jgi:NAD(P)-dependent dehydrogenase (short-subunit alcohol dehydrogenase family)
LAGKVSVITGGSSGIGLATVERFVAEGASVVFCDLAPQAHDGLGARLGATKARLHHYRDREAGGPHDGYAIAERLGPRATFVPADVTDESQLDAVMVEAVSRFGGLDVLYNNAAVGGAEGFITEGRVEIFDRVIEVNLKAVWTGIRLAAPRMIDRGAGSILITASIGAVIGIPGLTAYSAAKAGLLGMMRSAASELGPHRIRVNAISPGSILTPMAYNSPMSDAPPDIDSLRQMSLMAQPIPKVGEPDDIAKAAVFLASDDSEFITGHNLVVDGGRSTEITELAPRHHGGGSGIQSRLGD